MPNSFRSFITKPPSTAREGWNLCLYRLLPLPHLSSNHSKFLFGEAAAIIVVDTILRLLHLACVHCNSTFLFVSNSIITSVHWASTIFSYRIRCLMCYWRSILSFFWDLSGVIKSWEHCSFSSTQAIAFPVSTEHLMYLSTFSTSSASWIKINQAKTCLSFWVIWTLHVWDAAGIIGACSWKGWQKI